LWRTFPCLSFLGWQGEVRLSFLLITKASPMSIQCPQCGSTFITTRDIGRRTGGAIGTVAGGFTGFSGALTGGRLGMTVGVIAGPAGSALGCLAGALIGGLVGAATVGVAGAKLGEVIDARVLDNLECGHCEHVFSAPEET
jgi:predicted RNA-binding Zn-ribbon protein involved in translation (DUF1610 family)